MMVTGGGAADKEDCSGTYSRSRVGVVGEKTETAEPAH